MPTIDLKGRSLYAIKRHLLKVLFYPFNQHNVVFVHMNAQCICVFILLFVTRVGEKAFRVEKLIGSSDTNNGLKRAYIKNRFPTTSTF